MERAKRKKKFQLQGKESVMDSELIVFGSVCLVTFQAQC